jgi:hypothetical protein
MTHDVHHITFCGFRLAVGGDHLLVSNNISRKHLAEGRQVIVALLLVANDAARREIGVVVVGVRVEGVAAAAVLAP